MSRRMLKTNSLQESLNFSPSLSAGSPRDIKVVWQVGENSVTNRRRKIFWFSTFGLWCG